MHIKKKNKCVYKLMSLCQSIRVKQSLTKKKKKKHKCPRISVASNYFLDSSYHHNPRQKDNQNHCHQYHPCNSRRNLNYVVLAMEIHDMGILLKEVMGTSSMDLPKDFQHSQNISSITHPEALVKFKLYGIYFHIKKVQII